MTATPRSLNLAEVDSAWGPQVVEGNRLVQDSRQIQTGDVFVAMGSTGASGHEFIEQAISKGANTVVVDQQWGKEALEIAQRLQFSGAVIPVPHLWKELPRIADAFWGFPSQHLTIVGVTGTNGKTSVVQLLVQAWHHLGLRCASIGTLGVGVHGQKLVSTGLTTPSVSQVHEILASFVDAGVTHVGIEVSSHALDQQRVGAVRFAQVAFTNLTRDHLDFHGTMEAYAAAKEKIFELAGTPAAVLNIDDAYGEKMFNTYLPTRAVLGVSSAAHPQASITAHNVQLAASGLACDIEFEGEIASVSSSLVGRFNVDNLLLTSGILLSEGFTAHQIVEVLPQLTPVFGRMNKIQPTPDSPLVIIDYAHTPDALQQGLAALADYNFKRIITVFGCTGDRDAGKRPEMAAIAESASDLVIVTDDDVHHEDGDKIVADIRRGFQNPDAVIERRDRGEALHFAISHATAGDVVFIAGKGHEEFLVVGDDLVPFSDTAVAEELLARKAAGKL